MENERVIECGQVYYLRYDDSVGAETAVGRPVLVVSNPDEIKKKQTVVVLLMTTQKHDLNKSVKVLVNNRPNYILCDQIRTLDKSRLNTYMTKISDADLKRVRGALVYVLSLTGILAGVSGNTSIITSENESVKAEDVGEVKATVEAELYQKLYMKAMTDLVEVRYRLDELQLKYDLEKKRSVLVPDTPGVDLYEDRVVDKEPVVKETIVDVEALKQKMTTPNSEMRIDDPPIVKEVEVAEPVDRDECIPEILGKSSGGNKKKKKAKALTRKEIDEILIKKGFNVSGSGSGSGRSKLAKGAKPVNVNVASYEDFKAIGMGNRVAQELVRHRNAKGKYESFEDLLLVTNFGPVVARIFGPYLEI